MAEQSTHPACGSQVANPRHVPMSFFFTQGFSVPWEIIVQSHAPEFGTHWRPTGASPLADTSLQV